MTDPANLEPRPMLSPAEIAGRIDSLLLAPELLTAQVQAGCEVARRLELASVIVRPCDVETAARWLEGSSVRLGSVVNAPHGYSTTAAKLYEGRDLLRRGVRELEFTLNTGRMLDRQFQHLESELHQMSESCAEVGARMNVAFHLSLFAPDLRLIALKLCRRSDANFVVIHGPCSPPELAFLQAHIGDRVRLKAGSETTLQSLLASYQGGCERFGAADPENLLREAHTRAAQNASPSDQTGNVR